MFKAKIKRWATLTTAKPSNLKDTLTSQTKSSILWSAPFCWYFTPCLPAQLRRRDHYLFSVALKRTWEQQCLTSLAVLHLHRDIDIDIDSHALIYFRKISSYWLWLRTLNSNNANYYVFWFLQQEFITSFELFCIAKFLLQIYKITLKTSGQYGNMNRLRIKRCIQ